ncbi:DUF7344 domain-containing protein [Halocatena marina]|uniref:DUF7344 domain-containing protein n=1 Tax=Halocatena marina TaxID=2934937 RepID=UPI00200EB61D|nr:hypothetical protein [Halocatena marina]
MTSWKGENFLRSHNPAIEAITSEERRMILDALLTQSPLTEGALVEFLATSEKERESDSPTREALQIDLFHTNLPTLKATDLIAWDQSKETVETTNHPALTDPRFSKILKLDSDGLNTALRGISHEYRRIALTILRDKHEPISRDTLAREIAQRCETQTVPETAMIEEVAISLHHTHFPKLCEMNLITYDADTERASYTANQTLEEVFKIIYDPDQSIVDKYEGFLRGLQETYPQPGQDRRTLAEWPFWGEFHYG